MARYDFLQFDSVIGFEHKDVETEIIDSDGSVRKYRGGIRSTYIPSEVKPITHKECNQKWFTNFNEALLNKIRDYHKHNL